MCNHSKKSTAMNKNIYFSFYKRYYICQSSAQTNKKTLYNDLVWYSMNQNYLTVALYNTAIWHNIVKWVCTIRHLDIKGLEVFHLVRWYNWNIMHLVNNIKSMKMLLKCSFHFWYKKKKNTSFLRKIQTILPNTYKYNTYTLFKNLALSSCSWM